MGASESEKLSFPPCIAREIMEREFSVLYFSAPQLFSVLTQTKFDRNDVDSKNMNDYIFNCDLLIIDDLGSEYTNAFIAAQFFTCINERLIHKKSTIISTNLSLESLANLYTERSFSRITSSYALLKIIGDDIRIKEKIKKIGRYINVTPNRTNFGKYSGRKSWSYFPHGM